MEDGFHFLNFSPRIEFSSYANQRLNSIVEKVPSDSVVRAYASRHQDSFVFEIRIFSPSGTFVSSIKLLAPRGARDRLWQKSAIDYLEQDLHAQIYAWNLEHKGYA